MPPRPPPPTVLRGHEASVTTLSFNASKLLSGDASGVIKLWDIALRRAQRSWNAHDPHALATGGVLTVKWLNESTFLSYGRDGALRRWSIDKSEPIFEKRMSSVGFCSFHIQGDCIALATDVHKLIILIDLISGDILDEFVHPEEVGLVMCLKWIRPGVILAGYETGHLCLWNVIEKRIITSVSAHNEPVLSINVNNSSEIVTGCAGVDVRIWDANLEEKGRFSLPCEGVQSLVYGHDDRVIAVGCWDSRIRLYRSHSPFNQLAALTTHTDTVNCLIYEQGFLWSAGKDGRICMFKLWQK